MTKEQMIKKFYEEFPHAPNPVHEPIKFAYYKQLCKYLYNSNTNVTNKGK